MNNDKSDRRTETAKQHDDSEVISEAKRNPSPDKVGRAGGNLARDVGTEAAERKVRNPESRENMTKEQELRHKGSAASEANKG